MATIGEEIKRLRKVKGLTQKQLSDLTGVSQQALGGWESGKFSPSLEKLQALSKALGVDPGKLLVVDLPVENKSNAELARLEAELARLEAEVASLNKLLDRQEKLIESLEAQNRMLSQLKA